MTDEETTLALTRRFRKYHRDAQNAVKILCPLLTAINDHYQVNGVVNSDLADHVQVMMNQLYNNLTSMESVLEKEDIPF